MPRLPNPRRALPWRLLALAAVVTVGTVGLGAALVEPAPGRIVATDDEQVADLAGARPVSADAPAAQDVVAGAHLRTQGASPRPPRPTPADPTSTPDDAVRPELESEEVPADAVPQGAARTPSPDGGRQLTGRPTPSEAPSPSASPTPTGSPEPVPEPEPSPTKPPWWPW